MGKLRLGEGRTRLPPSLHLLQAKPTWHPGGLSPASRTADYRGILVKLG